MSRTQLYRKSALALGIALALYGNSGFGEDKPKDKVIGLEEIVVTGSLIKGSLEKSAQPLEVISQEELENLGRPSNLDLVRAMSEEGAAAGEANRFNAFPVGAAAVNLRSLGPRFSLVVFNNRRFPEQYSLATGRFNNINWIPNAAIGSIEVLKEGGGVTYGADAIGGVVNYKTKQNLQGLEVNADYRYIKDDSGDYTADLSWGKIFDNSNVMVVAAYQHRSTLMAIDRPWSQPSYFEIKSPTTVTWPPFGGSPGAYIFQRPAVGTGTLTPITPTGTSAAGTLYAGDRQIGSSGAVRDPNCTALGGFAGWSATPTPTCYINTGAFENLVQEQNQYQLYAEYNLKFAKSMEFHTEALYYQQDLPDIANPPSDSLNAGGFPMTSTGALQTIAPGVNGYFVSGKNPAVLDFLSNFRNSNGTLVYGDPTVAGTQANAIVNGGRVALQNGLWRPFGVGGNPVSGLQDKQHNNTKMYRLTTELKGALPEFLGTKFEWSVAATYSRVDYSLQVTDMLTDRLQAALNGLGGPNCTGTTPGAGGCLWFDPFSSAIQGNVYTGQTNPNYVAGLANSADLVNWMRVPLELQRRYNYLWTDWLVSGETGINLPGGPISAALGFHSTYSDELFTLDDLSNRAVSPCGTVGSTLCLSQPASQQLGPLVYGRNINQLGVFLVPPKRKYPSGAIFTEWKFPILDSVQFSLAGRYEKFFSDISDKDNSVFVPAGSLKWQALDWLAWRVSAGKSFSQVNPPLNDGPIFTTPSTIPNTQFGGAVGYTTGNYDNVDVKPMHSQYLSSGFLLQKEAFSASVDYWYVNIDDYTRTMTANNVLSGLVGGAPSGNLPSNTLIDCSSPLLIAPIAALGGRPYVQLAAPCVQGTSTLSNSIGAGTVVNFFGTTNESNSGKQTSTGIDLNASYRFDNVLGGRLTPSIDATYNLKWLLGDFVLGGVTVAPRYDGLGYKNSSTGRIGTPIPEYRATFGLLYTHGKHTLNILTSYIPSVINENAADFAAPIDNNANIGVGGVVTAGTPASCLVPGGNLTSDLGNVPAGAGTGEFGVASVGAPAGSSARGFCGTQAVTVNSARKIAASTNVDLTYRMELSDRWSTSLTIYNVLDARPSFDRASVGYNAGFGSPLERNVKLGIKAKF